MAATLHSRPVALIGLSGAGKSTLAPLLAERLGGEPVDVDARVEARAGCRIAEVFARLGEAGFRRLEHAELVRAVDAGAGVIACGGGIVETPEARALLRTRCRGVWLEVTSAEAAARLGSSASDRPLIGSSAPATRLDELLARRREWYADVAVARVRTDGLAVHELLDQVARALERAVSAEGPA